MKKNKQTKRASYTSIDYFPCDSACFTRGGYIRIMLNIGSVAGFASYTLHNLWKLREKSSNLLENSRPMEKLMGKAFNFVNCWDGSSVQ